MYITLEDGMKDDSVNEEIEPTNDGASPLKTEPGFTLGEWRVKESKVPGYERNIDVVAGNLRICEVTGGGVSNPVVLAQVRANARLLAAAPALYEAAKKAANELSVMLTLNPARDGGLYQEALDALNAALALVDQNQEQQS